MMNLQMPQDTMANRINLNMKSKQIGLLLILLIKYINSFPLYTFNEYTSERLENATVEANCVVVHDNNSLTIFDGNACSFNSSYVTDEWNDDVIKSCVCSGYSICSTSSDSQIIRRIEVSNCKECNNCFRISERAVENFLFYVTTFICASQIIWIFFELIVYRRFQMQIY